MQLTNEAGECFQAASSRILALAKDALRNKFSALEHAQRAEMDCLGRVRRQERMDQRQRAQERVQAMVQRNRQRAEDIKNAELSSR